MNLRYIDWIWHVQGSLALAPGQSVDDAFDRLTPLFEQPGTSHQRTKDMVTFQKKDPVAQDKMSIFETGILAVEKSETELVLQYRLHSPTLLFCFLLPFLFLGISQLTVEIGKHQKPPVEKAEKADKVSETAMNSIDKALGAPAPDKPNKAKAVREKAEKAKKKFSPTPAYVFAALFAALYALGRIFEDRLIRANISKHLMR